MRSRIREKASAETARCTSRPSAYRRASKRYGGPSERESRLLANPATVRGRRPPLRRNVVGAVRSQFAFDLEAVLCDRRAPVRICESCDAVCIEDAWYHADLITFVWRVDPHVSHAHTICPECIVRAVPGVP